MEAGDHDDEALEPHADVDQQDDRIHEQGGAADFLEPAFEVLNKRTQTVNEFEWQETTATNQTA